MMVLVKTLLLCGWCWCHTGHFGTTWRAVTTTTGLQPAIIAGGWCGHAGKPLVLTGAQDLGNHRSARCPLLCWSCAGTVGGGGL